MRQILTFLFATLLGVVAATAQSHQDFADKFLSLYSETYELHCQTISPQMMQRILQLDNVAGNKQTLNVLSQVRSLRILRAAEGHELFEKAQQLARRNKRRYTVQESDEQHGIYVRRRDKHLVEVVVAKVKEGNKFYLIDLTGTMSDDFIQQVLKL